jgi:hypothetical protein
MQKCMREVVIGNQGYVGEGAGVRDRGKSEGGCKTTR